MFVQTIQSIIWVQTLVCRRCADDRERVAVPADRMFVVGAYVARPR